MKKIGIGLLALAALLGSASFALFYTHAGQDFLFSQGAAQMASVDIETFDGLEAMVCGSSSPLPSATRAQACIVVRAGEQMFVVDAGSGSASVLALNRVPLQHLKGVLLTHFHSDHIADLWGVNLNSWVAGRPQPLLVIGPPGVDRVVSGANIMYSQDHAYRVAHHGSDLLPPELGILRPQPIPLGLFFDYDGLAITAFPVDHSPIEPAYGYRFEYKGRSIVITGDTIVTDELAAAADGVDVLFTDALSQDLVEGIAGAADAMGMANRAQVLLDVLDYHASTESLGELDDRIELGQMILYHLVPPPLNGVTEQIFRRGLPSDAVISYDGMRVRLPADSEAIEIR